MEICNALLILKQEMNKEFPLLGGHIDQVFDSALRRIDGDWYAAYKRL